MTVQLPDSDGTMGNSKGGAGNVNTVWADAELETASMVPSAVSNAAKNVRWAPPLVDEWRRALTACFIGGPLTPGAFFWQGRLVWLGATRWCAYIAPRLPSLKQTGTPGNVLVML